MASLRDKDDGYRGWLHNPKTGRKFRANKHTSRRTDLERISGPDAEPQIKSSRSEPPVPAPAAPADVDEAAVAANADEATAAMDDLLEQAHATEDKAELKAIGAQLGVKLTQNMNAETMTARIEEQVATIKAATE